MSKEIVFHIGASKCGSSSLQSILSSNPVVQTKDGVYRYGVIQPNEAITKFDGFEESVLTPVGYCSSHKLAKFEELEIGINQIADQLISDISGLSKQDAGLIFSCEAWLHEIPKILIPLFSRLRENGVKVRVVCYFRPQAQWINSAWWQWGAWGKKGKNHNAIFSAFFNRMINAPDWAGYLPALVNVLDEEECLIVGLTSQNVIHHFFEVVLRCEVPEHTWSNQSLSSEVLRFFQHNQNLRSDPHTAMLDFIISRHFEPKSSAPWVLGPGMLKMVFERFEESNRTLANYLSPEISEQFLQDDSWWEPQFYLKNQERETPNPVQLEYQQLNELCVEAFEVIQQLSIDNFALQRKLNKQKGTIHNGSVDLEI